MSTLIIGAGMAGLLAAAMLRGKALAVWEAQKELPHNHNSLLRFRSSVVGDVLGIPFRPVRVMKAVASIGNPVADALAYSRKTNGAYSLRSSITANGQIEDRWVAPADLVHQMAQSIMCPIEFGKEWGWELAPEDASFISTIPMPKLMNLLDWRGPRPDFGSSGGITIECDMGPAVDAYVTLYVPQADLPFSRVSITGSLFQIEFSNRDWSSSMARARADRMKESDIRGAMIQAMNLMGISPIDVPYERAIVKPQAYAKILPVDEAIRKRFIIWASEEHRVYSLGRFATWRPGLLLDDVVNDVRVIQRLMGGSSRYDHTK